MNEVVAELYGNNFEDSEDDFDGYFEMESDNDVYTYTILTSSRTNWTQRAANGSHKISHDAP